MAEWIRFWISAVLLGAGLFSFISAVIGVHRFGFSMNRMHAAGIGDTLGIFCVIASLVVASGVNLDSLKLILLIFFMWFTSPVSTHFLGQVEYYSNQKIREFLRKQEDSPYERPGGMERKKAGEAENLP